MKQDRKDQKRIRYKDDTLAVRNADIDIYYMPEIDELLLEGYSGTLISPEHFSASFAFEFYDNSKKTGKTEWLILNEAQQKQLVRVGTL